MTPADNEDARLKRDLTISRSCYLDPRDPELSELIPYIIDRALGRARPRSRRRSS
jgi:hypothetical protein